MAKEYVELLEAMLQPAIRALDGNTTVVIKHSFKGAAAYVNGRICITLTPAGLAMKLPEKSWARLVKRDATTSRYFSKGAIKKEYVLLPLSIRNNTRKLKYWAGRSFIHVLALRRSKRE